MTKKIMFHAYTAAMVTLPHRVEVKFENAGAAFTTSQKKFGVKHCVERDGVWHYSAKAKPRTQPKWGRVPPPRTKMFASPVKPETLSFYFRDDVDAVLFKLMCG